MQLDVLAFRACFTESRSREIMEKYVPAQLPYIDMLRRLGETLGVGGEQAILKKRSELGEQEYVRMLFDDANIAALIVDDGYNSAKALPIPEFEKLCGRPIYQCRRIEAVLEECIAATDTFDGLSKEFAWRLIAETPLRPVALKTIMAYRGGLALDMVTAEQAAADYARVKSGFSSGQNRITRCPLYHYFLMQAFEMAACHSLPVQVHTGLGDDDQDLIQSNPALLQPLFRLRTLSQTQWMLLHCFPYVRDAALMCALYPNVTMDLSLAINLASPLADTMLVESYSVAPYTKVLSATDGHSVAETFWYAATIWNESLARLQLPSAPPRFPA